MKLLSAFLLAVAFSAQAAPSVHLEGLTWTELRDAIKAGKTTILVPIGGTEQNGPHMAIGKHNARVRILAERIATGLGNAIVAPVVAYVPEGTVEPPTAHMRFPGTITVPEDVFEKTLESTARSFRRHGFRDIVFLGDHGGYRVSLNAVATRLNRLWGRPGPRVHALEEYYRAAKIEGHAGRDDTSLTMSLVPDMVRNDRLGPEAARTAADGIQGDPRGASVDEGQRIAKSIVDASVEAIRKAVRR